MKIRRSVLSPAVKSVSQSRTGLLASFGIAIIVALAVSQPAAAQIDLLGRDLGAKDMSQVSDVTGGMTYLLEDDDLLKLAVNLDANGNVTTTLAPLHTSDGGFAGTQPQPIQIDSVNPGTQFTPGSGVASEAAGRMYQTASDVVTTLNATVLDGNSQWMLTVLDPRTNYTARYTMADVVPPAGKVSTQVVLGDFRHDKLREALAYTYSSAGQGSGALTIVAPEDPTKENGQFLQGGQVNFPDQGTFPVPGAIVVGDFNGTGGDQIAVLMNDYQTIEFYGVDPNTLRMVLLTTLVLPDRLVQGQAALVAGNFRSTANDELVAIGQSITGPANQYTIYAVAITPGSNGSFRATIANTDLLPAKPTQFSPVLGQAGALAVWPQVSPQMLVTGINSSQAAFFEIGCFLSDFSYVPASESELGYTHLYNMQLGSFDNSYTTGDYLPALQLEAYIHLYTNNNNYTIIDNINVPPSFTTCQKGMPPGDWVSFAHSEQDNNVASLLDVVIPGDVEGRSLRLGPPEVVRINKQIQPEIVLGIPPMHIDYINPDIAGLGADKYPGCQDPPNPCVLNVTVMPDVPAPGIGFGSGFNFNVTSQNEAQRDTTTSWGVSVKETTSIGASFDAGVAGGSSKITESAMYAHDHVVESKYNKYTAATKAVATTTGFADHIFFTTEGVNVYYYPILGVNACGRHDQNCNPDSPDKQEYVEFSVPDKVHHYQADAYNQWWYQPVQEPGNVLSYPWSKSQLQAGFNYVDTSVNAITQTPAPCRLTDSSSESYTTSWLSGTGQSLSAGSANSFAGDISFSASGRAGIGSLGAKFSFKLDLGASYSLNTLNQNTETLDSSLGVTVQKPQFDTALQHAWYYFGSYIFGQQNEPNPPYQTITLTGPHGQPVNKAQQTPGPLFVGFIADPPTGTGGDCDSGTDFWWQQVYQFPDIAVNHPSRWTWTKSPPQASFSPRNDNVSPLEENFWLMKGFYLTRSGESTTSPNLSSATAGDQLDLTARIYNYSVVDTSAIPDSHVMVAIYGQNVCESGSNLEPSCRNGTQTCQGGELCGNGFLIGHATLDSIPGFKSPSTGGNQPNWKLVSVPFDTSNYAGSYLAFWVGAWLVDRKGNWIPGSEMPSHGFTSAPPSLESITQITDFPSEMYSNNVGLYGSYQPFFVYPQQQGLGSVGKPGFLRSLRLSSRPIIDLEQRTKVASQIEAGGAPVDDVTIAYYDGDPANGGTLYDVQSITHMEPDLVYSHRAFFTPESCGIHRLFTEAWLSEEPAKIATYTTNVTIRPVDKVQGLMRVTRATSTANTSLRLSLLATLNLAQQYFQQQQEQQAAEEIMQYRSEVQNAMGKGIHEQDANVLIGQANTLLSCVPPPPTGGRRASAAPHAPSPIH